MTSTRLFRNSIATGMLVTALVVAPIAAQAQDSAPPPPDQYNNQYAPQPGMQQDAAIQNGAPQGVAQAPPAIPDYDQPPAPGDGYIWTPGYWAWSGDGYEWVQGAWVAAPYTGALWTPGYWGYGYNGYFWNAGYWGPYVGYYGGINYGFGYFGIGFYGGYWGGGRFWYNRSYCNYRGGFGYSRAYNGYSGRPGGSSFVHTTSIAGSRGAGTTAGFRGSSINGRTSNFAQGAGRSYAGASNYNSGARSYAQSSQSHGSYASAPHYSAPFGGGGGGFHGGGGGGSHGGGGGHR